MDSFKLSPQKNYSSPSYPSQGKVSGALRKGSLALGATVLLSLSSCVFNVEDNHSIIDGDMPDCTPGDLTCADDGVNICVEGEGANSWNTMTCTEYCQQEFGYDYYPYGGGCDMEDPTNLCGCEYDILEGEMAWCDMGDLYCGADGSINVCDQSTGGYDNYSCDDYCTEAFGEGFYSIGECSTEGAPNECQCTYDMLDGMVGECVPGDLLCINDEVLSECREGDDGPIKTFERCDRLCEEEFGLGYISMGCDTQETENPCTCILPEKK